MSTFYNHQRLSLADNYVLHFMQSIFTKEDIKDKLFKKVVKAITIVLKYTYVSRHKIQLLTRSHKFLAAMEIVQKYT